MIRTLVGAVIATIALAAVPCNTREQIAHWAAWQVRPALQRLGWLRQEATLSGSEGHPGEAADRTSGKPGAPASTDDPYRKLREEGVVGDAFPRVGGSHVFRQPSRSPEASAPREAGSTERLGAEPSLSPEESLALYDRMRQSLIGSLTILEGEGSE